MDVSELMEALSRPDAYPRPVDRVEVRQTHVSMLFFAGPRVYKVKKPVRLGFLDFSTVERRRQFCVEEVRLNRRLAADVYLGVVEVVQDEGGRVRIDAPGRVIDHAVCMVRLPEDRMLDRMLGGDAVDGRILEAVVRLLVAFHAGAATGPGVDDHGTPDAVRARMRRNLDEAARFGGADGAGTIPDWLLAFLADRQRRFLARHGGAMQRRVDAGRVREGHGDLHAGNICVRRVPDDIVVYDCIEFDRALRCGDVAADLAFLAMDLDFLGHPQLARDLSARYASLADDPGLEELMPLYCSHYAGVRGKVHSIAAAEPELPASRRCEEAGLARRYFDLAAGYWLQPLLVLMCGLPGTGKSFLAARLAAPLMAVVLRSDVVRKQLAGMAATERWTGGLDAGPYAPEHTGRTYDRLLERAAGALAAGRSVIVDATFAERRRRDRFVEAAARRGAGAIIAHVDCAEETVRGRLRSRRAAAGSISDADEAVYDAARGRFEPPAADELAGARGVRLDGGSDRPEREVRALLERLAGARAGAGPDP
ncbi:MAG: bifunctional aminoglycoside phosphotransferase/ATP-binding protein [Planctomycetota bacterium]|jgi:aminoglycoside phosphotransferase family enzyme